MKVPSTGGAHVRRIPGSSVEKRVSYGCFLYAASISLPRRNSAALHGEGATPTSGATLGTPPPNPAAGSGATWWQSPTQLLPRACSSPASRARVICNLGVSHHCACSS